jgi:hypothetical protein
LKQREVAPIEATPVDELAVQSPLTEEQIKSLYLFDTTAYYESGLARAIEIFFAGPATPERLELATLVPRLIHYENKYIYFHKLYPLDVIKLKMKE